jgi:short-subunit dehydrogenase
MDHLARRKTALVTGASRGIGLELAVSWQRTHESELDLDGEDGP